MFNNIFCFSIITLLSVSAISQSDSVRFAVFGDYGVNNSNEQSVADLVKSWSPDFIITAGDNSYGSTAIDDNVGKYFSDYIGNYTGSYGSGSPTNQFFPSIGNHGYSDGGGISAYLSYFTLPGAGVASSNTSGKEHYYDFVQGPVHFFALNSNSQESDGNNSSSTQANWLQTQLSASTAMYKIVYMHHPPYSSSSNHGSQTVMQWPFEDWGATAIFAGHDHTYERILRDDNGDSKMVSYFVTGLGGRCRYGFPSSDFVSGSQVRYNDNFGSMLVDATIEYIIFKFYSIAGGASGTLIDSFKINRTSVGVNDDEDIILPGAFSLRQNYPNPFNLMTTIEYNLPTKSHVEIRIYNMLGQKVRTLIDETKSVGKYNTTWDGTNVFGVPVATGVYLYRFQAEDHIETKKMLLLK